MGLAQKFDKRPLFLVWLFGLSVLSAYLVNVTKIL